MTLEQLEKEILDKHIPPEYDCNLHCTEEIYQELTAEFLKKNPITITRDGSEEEYEISAISFPSTGTVNFIRDYNWGYSIEEKLPMKLSDLMDFENGVA